MSGQGWCVREGVIILITKNAGLLSNYLYVIIDRQLIIQDARFVIAIYYYLRSYPHGFPLSQYLKPAVEKTAFILDLLEGVYLSEITDMRTDRVYCDICTRIHFEQPLS